ncbi:MAG: complex I NDUFA9 subunit family protein [Kiloniellales bacterium]
MDREPLVAVFGGTGFLGSAIVECLAARGFRVRVAVRHPERAPKLPAEVAGTIEPIKADVRDTAAVRRAVAGCRAAVNAVGLYLETGGATFEAVHVDGAAQVAQSCAAEDVARLVHVSGIGAARDSPSGYVRARAKGEAAVRAAFPDATILRPSVLFGPGDAFFTSLAAILRVAPVMPLFGRGETRLQPVYVGDVAEAAARALQDEAARGKVFELGGPDIYSYRALLDLTLRHVGRRRALLPLPFVLWDLLARLGSVLPRPPITDAQVELMKADNVAAGDLPGLAALGITPTPLQSVLPRILGQDGDGA